MKKFSVVAGVSAGVIAIVASSSWWVLTRNADNGSSVTSNAQDHSRPVTPLPVVDAKGLSGLDTYEQGIIRQLRQLYPDGLQGIALQVKVISTLMQQLLSIYPDDWQQRLLRILVAAFPGQAAELRDCYDGVLAYKDWMDQILPHMTFSSGEARKQAIWDKRIAIFGNDAYTIWASERREQELAVTLDQLATSGEPLERKTTTYIEALRKTYGEGVIGPQAPHLTQNMTRFLQLDSVQRDLKSLPADARREELRSFRKAMGLDDAALERWDQLDQERDSLRNTGTDYLNERARLEAQYQGPELEQQITSLQNRLFGEAEAQFLRNEEAAGYFRFKVPQTLGVN